MPGLSLSSVGLSLRGLASDLAGPFDLDVAPGQAVVISGASGSGKSVFLRMVADLDPCCGEVELGGVSRSQMSGPAWRTLAPYVAAESAWWADLLADHFQPAHLAAAQVLATRLGVNARAWDGPVSRLSTGERQRLALIRALVLEPPLLLLDEPTGPLDPLSTAAVEAVLAERIAAGGVLLMVSHDAGQAQRLAAARYRMIDGRLEAAA